MDIAYKGTKAGNNVIKQKLSNLLTDARRQGESDLAL